MCHQVSFANIATLFGLPSAQGASNVFYRQLLHQYKYYCNIPSVIFNDQVNQPEVDKLLREAYERTPHYYKVLMNNFEDPDNRDRTPVPINIDGTYIDIQGSSDLQLQKHMYYGPRAGHVVKFLNLTDLCPKFLGVFPVASSQTPSSGDGLLLAKHIELEDSSDTGQYMRSILRGNDEYFVVLICDAGFVIDVHNAPVQSRGENSVTLAQVCEQERCVLLHTSSKYERYHLEKTASGKIRKVPWVAGNPSLDQNVIKFTRMLRKMQEQIHAALKAMFKILDMRHMWNDCLLPLSSKQMEMLDMPPEFKDVPKLTYIVTVCCSLLNAYHPGFYPLYMDALEHVRAAKIFLARLFLENPLLHPEIWPVDFTKARTGNDWQEMTFGDLAENDVLNFPKLDRHSINPVAIELVSGPHALKKADSILTYMGQLLIQNQNLTREETVNQLQRFPDDWKFQYMEIKAPSDFQATQDCPRWVPDWWEPRFGLWHDLKLVRCRVPPSYRSATSPANFHWVVIGFGPESSDRNQLRPPYNRIYFWKCFKCPALSGSISMDRHLAAFLKALSFKDLYSPTNKTVNILNTVAQPRRQTTRILPPTQASRDIPLNIPRRSRNTRRNLGGHLDPLYDLSFTASSPAVSIPPTVTAASETQNVTDRENNDSQANMDTNSTDETVAQDLPAMPGNQWFDQRTRQSPVDLLERHLQDLDPNNIFNIPNASQNQLGPDTIFTASHLQHFGLLNDSNICSLISLILCFHRIALKNYLIDPDNLTLDLSSLVFFKVLSALPSQDSFSLQLFIDSWNESGKAPRIHPGFTDVAALAEGLISNLQFKEYSSRPPAITQFLGTFHCPKCGKDHTRVKNWELQVQSVIPLLQLPPNDHPVDICALFEAYLGETFETRCSNNNCKERIIDGRLEMRLGRITVLAVNRLDIRNPNGKRLNRVELGINNNGQDLLGDLVCVISHRGDVNAGHFVSYHKVSGQWYHNNDSRPCIPTEDPLGDIIDNNETVELLFFQNNVE